MPGKCTHCGAAIDPLALACPYCKMTTPAGVLARQREEHERKSHAQWHAHAQAQAQQQDQVVTQRRLDSAATHALLWSIAGTVICCAPLGIVAIVLGARARSIASSRNMPIPVKATVGLILGMVSTVSSIGFFVYAIVASQREEAASKDRVAVIEKQIGGKAASAALERETACGLAEIHVLRNGWKGNRGQTLSQFDCVGKLAVSADHAALENFRFRYDTGNANYDVSVCFKRGGKWYVDEVRDDACVTR